MFLECQFSVSVSGSQDSFLKRHKPSQVLHKAKWWETDWEHLFGYARPGIQLGRKLFFADVILILCMTVAKENQKLIHKRIMDNGVGKKRIGKNQEIISQDWPDYSRLILRVIFSAWQWMSGSACFSLRGRWGYLQSPKELKEEAPVPLLGGPEPPQQEPQPPQQEPQLPGLLFLHLLPPLLPLPLHHYHLHDEVNDFMKLLEGSMTYHQTHGTS